MDPEAVEEFEFAAWCTENELEPDTVTLLQAKGFKTYKSLSRFSESYFKSDKDLKALIPGQQAMIMAGVELLQPPKNPKQQPGQDKVHPPVIPNVADATDDTSATTAAAAAAATALDATGDPVATPTNAPAQPLTSADVMKLWQAMSGASIQPPATPAPPSDPFGFGTGPYRGRKFRKVNEYITNMYAVDPSYDAEETMNIGGVEFAVSKGKKLPMDKVKLSHYMEGALRVLREMVVEEQLPQDQVVHHLNYLIQVACFAQSKPWQQVLGYDTIYRREQHQHGFAWGTGSSFLMTSQLMSQPTQQPTHATKTQTGSKQTPKQVVYPPSGKPVCGRFNSKQGCDQDSCVYEHVCKQCFAKHSQQVHFTENATLPEVTKNI